MQIEIPIPGSPYSAHVGRGLLTGCGPVIREACGGGKACALVTDTTVGALYAETVRRSLEEAGARVVEYRIPDGEPSKTLARAGEICEAMARGGLDRTAFVVALGGGVVGDLAGFAAAVFLRGLPYAQIPTTLLAQVDSSVGGKTGVNLPGGKNLVGAFHQPRVVIADTATWDTLPRPIFAEGLAEAIKHGAIRDPALALRAGELAADDPPAFVARNIAIKAAVVCADERETLGLREHLNFGHTVGHAVEHAAGYGRLLHGEAVAIGMAAALELSKIFAGLPETEAGGVREALASAGLPLRLPPGIPPETVLEAVARDKKFREGRMRFVLLRRLGEPYIEEGVTPAGLRRVVATLGN